MDKKIIHSYEQPETISKGEQDQLLNQVAEIQQSRTHNVGQAKKIPYLLLPYQAKWNADNAGVRICEKSRRIGFSWGCLAAEGALEASHRKGMDQFYMGFNKEMAAENIGDVLFFAKIYGQAISKLDVSRHTEITTFETDNRVIESERAITKYAIRFASGFKYEALSSSPNNWRGRQGHARIDEAAFHENIQEVVKAALAFKLWGGRISIVSTHNGEDNQFNLWIKDCLAGVLNWSHHRIDFDQALAQGFYKRICLIRGIEYSKKGETEFKKSAFKDYPDQSDANEELSCQPKKSTGSYFNRLIIEKCQDDSIPVLSWYKPNQWVMDLNRHNETDQFCNDILKPVIDSLPTDQRTVYGQDYARTSDLSVIWILQRVDHLHWRTAFILELRNIPGDQQLRIGTYIIDNLPLFHHAKLDATGNGAQHGESLMQKFGTQKIDPVKLSGTWYDSNFSYYKSAYESNHITVPKSEDLIADHRVVELVKGNPRMGKQRIKGSDGKYRHGDSVVAGLMAWSAARVETEPSFGVNIENSKDVYKSKRKNNLQQILRHYYGS